MLKTIVLGSTAVGKSEYALDLAKEQGAEIISVDSMQIYKYMDIGTAKLTREEMLGIPHHMIDIVEPSVQYSVAEYIETVKKIITKKKDSPLIFCGGSGLYLNALINGLAFPIAEKNDKIREELRTLEETKGKQHLWDELNKVDPEAASKIHPNDSYRTIRALEVFKVTGEKFSKQAITTPSILGNEFKIIGLTGDREKIYQRCDQRVEKMLEKGLLDEVQGLLDKGYNKDSAALQAIGYKEVIEHFDDKYTEKEMIEEIKKGTRHLAKKQFTWFRSFPDIEWLKVL